MFDYFFSFQTLNKDVHSQITYIQKWWVSANSSGFLAQHKIMQVQYYPY